MSSKVLPSDMMGNCCDCSTRLRSELEREENSGLLGTTPLHEGMIREMSVSSGKLEVAGSLAIAEEEARRLSDSLRAKILQGNADPFALDVSARQAQGQVQGQGERQKVYGACGTEGDGMGLLGGDSIRNSSSTEISKKDI
jgi:hypothetical protein